MDYENSFLAVVVLLQFLQMLDDKVQAGRDGIDFLISSLITAARSLILAAATILVPVLIGTYFGKVTVGALLPLHQCLGPNRAWTMS